MTAKAERRLPWLPDYGAPLPDWRDWLTTALEPAAGFRIEDFLRNGRQRGDTCKLIVLGPDGQQLGFEIEEQRLLMTSASLRAAVVSATDGLVRPAALTKPELEDIWVALCTLATVKANQSSEAEARDWIEQAEDAAEPITGYTLRPASRLDALQALKARGLFDRFAAFKLNDPGVDDSHKGRPALLIDSETGERWMRVGEVGAFLRHVLGVPPISYTTLDGRLAAVGVERVDYEVHRRTPETVHAKASLYRLADLPEDTEGEP